MYWTMLWEITKLFIANKKWIKKNHHYLSLRRNRQTKQDIVYSKYVCILFSFFIANSFSAIENICVMFQISTYGINSSTFPTGMSLSLNQNKPSSLLSFNTRTKVHHLAWRPGEQVHVLPVHKKSLSAAVIIDKDQSFVPQVFKILLTILRNL